MALILQSCKIWLQSAGFAWHWQSWKFFAGSVWILVMSTFCWNILQWSQARNALTVFHSYPEFRCLIPRCRYQLLSCRRVVWFSGRARHPAKMLARSGHEDTMWKHTEKTKAFATYFHGENARNGKAGNPSPQGKAARHRNIAVDPCGRCKDLSNIRPICNPLHSALGVRRFRCWFQSRNGQNCAEIIKTWQQSTEVLSVSSMWTYEWSRVFQERFPSTTASQILTDHIYTADPLSTWLEETASSSGFSALARAAPSPSAMTFIANPQKSIFDTLSSTMIFIPAFQNWDPNFMRSAALKPCR